MLTAITIKVTGKLLEQYMNNFYWTKRKENTIPPISGNTKIYDFVVPTSAQTVHILNSGLGLTSQIAKYSSKVRIPSIQLTTHSASKTWLCQAKSVIMTAYLMPSSLRILSRCTSESQTWQSSTPMYYSQQQTRKQNWAQRT